MTVFAEVYIPALPAVFDVPFVSASPPQTVALGDVVVLQSTSGPLFELALPVPAQFGPVGTLRVRARVAGTAGNVVPATITKIVSAPAGLSILAAPVVFVTAGRDIETPAEAIRRCLGKWATLGAGWTAESFDYLVPLFAPTVTRWLVRTDNPNGPGTIGIVLANPAGPATNIEVAAVLAGLTARNRFCLGCGGLTASAAVALTIALTATIKGDGSNPNLGAQASAALALLSLAFPLGPAQLVPELAGAVLLGGAFPGTIAIPTAGSMSTTITAPGLVGFSGAEAILVPPFGAAVVLSVGQVLVFSPLPVVVVT